MRDRERGDNLGEGFDQERNGVVPLRVLGVTAARKPDPDQKTGANENMICVLISDAIILFSAHFSFFGVMTRKTRPE